MSVLNQQSWPYSVLVAGVEVMSINRYFWLIIDILKCFKPSCQLWLSGVSPSDGRPSNIPGTCLEMRREMESSSVFIEVDASSVFVDVICRYFR